MGPHEKAVRESLRVMQEMASFLESVSDEESGVGAKYVLYVMALENLLPAARELDNIEDTSE